MLIYDRYGRQIDVDDDDVLRAGDRLVVPMTMMDGNRGAPTGNARDSSDLDVALRAAEDAREQYKARVSNAWRTPPENADTQKPHEYETYEQRLINAWRQR